jgi:uncharacterized protein
MMNAVLYCISDRGVYLNIDSITTFITLPFTFNTRWDIDGKLLSNKARYINHSCDPNCTVEITARTIWIVANRDITAGEELTYNYGYELDEEDAHPCICGATQCCGFILAPQYWGLLRNNKVATAAC